MNRTIVVFAEGDTERAAGDHLKKFLDERAGAAPKVRLHVVTFDGALTENSVRTRAEKYLEDPQTIGLVALTDLYPRYQSVDQARQAIGRWLPADARCHVHVAKHDFEAWLLVGWDEILRRSGIKNKKCWSPNPEDVDDQKPPAHRLKELFVREGKPSRRYHKPIDGKKLFEQLDLVQVAACCPEFKKFINCLLSLAGYEPLS